MALLVLHSFRPPLQMNNKNDSCMSASDILERLLWLKVSLCQYCLTSWCLLALKGFCSATNKRLLVVLFFHANIWSDRKKSHSANQTLFMWNHSEKTSHETDSVRNKVCFIKCEPFIHTLLKNTIHDTTIPTKSWEFLHQTSV